MYDISKIEDEIRELINVSRIREGILKRRSDWNALCSALDAIGDTELAVASFHKTPSDCFGDLYLATYGLLQALVVQQDAVSTIGRSLKIDVKFSARLREIRSIRNDTVGHPTDRDHGKYSCVIVRVSMSKLGFSYYQYNPDGKLLSDRYVNIVTVLEDQNEAVGTLLQKVVKEMKAREKSHKKKFKKKRLSECFPPTLNYAFQKIAETIDPELGGSPLGHAGYEVLCKHLDEFVEELKKRDELHDSDTVNYILREIDYPIQQLGALLNSSSECEINPKIGDIFVFFLQAKFKELEEIAIEIDEAYAF